MKVVFLDVDGVLNTEETFERNYQDYLTTKIRKEPIDEVRVKYLKEIIDATEAKIVLSSSWRRHCEFDGRKIFSNESHMAYLIQLLEKCGLYLYDITGYDREGNRGNEIKEWLEQNKVESFVVIDDSIADLQLFADNELIRTSFSGDEAGLCQKHVNIAIEKLNRSKRKKLVRRRNDTIRRGSWRFKKDS